MGDVSIQTLRPGERGRVLGFGVGNRDYRRRLLSFGMTPGTEFTISRVAPLGDPIELVVRGFSLTLRKSEADMVQVERVES